MNLKNNKGFTGIDVSVALVIFVLFTGIIASLIYNFGVKSKEIDRRAEATNISIQALEGAKQLNYDDIVEGNANSKVTINTDDTTEVPVNIVAKQTDATAGFTDLQNGYNIRIEVEKYNERDGKSDLEDLIKIITVTVKYTVGNEEQTVDISTTVTKEE